MKATTALLWAACLGYSMVILDTTVRNVALPSIAAETGSAPVQQQWIVDSYVLVMTAPLRSSSSRGAPAPRCSPHPS